MATPQKILLGITGGIAAYKTPELIRLLVKKGIAVQVVMTRTAEQFVTPVTLRSVSGERVLTADWNNQEDPFDHLNRTRGLAAALIAPATANFLGKLAHGVADDLLLTSVLALECPLFVAPSMNPRMYANPAVQDNIRILEGRGVHIIRPDEGEMACGDSGAGRLPSIGHLATVIEEAVGPTADLKGKRIIVTAGPTEEPIDAVRFISNRSSGRMGVAIAEAARDRGADVTLIHGPLSIPLPENITNISVRRAQEMMDELAARFGGCDMLVMAAAVSDFRPSVVYDSKMKKNEAGLSISLEQNPDILERLGKHKENRLIIGFAAETDNLLQNAREKLLRKNMDVICANDVGRGDIGFDNDYNEITLISRTREPLSLPRLPKRQLADRILDEAARLLSSPRAAASGQG